MLRGGKEKKKQTRVHTLGGQQITQRGWVPLWGRASCWKVAHSEIKGKFKEEPVWREKQLKRNRHQVFDFDIKKAVIVISPPSQPTGTRGSKLTLITLHHPSHRLLASRMLMLKKGKKKKDTRLHKLLSPRWQPWQPGFLGKPGPSFCLPERLGVAGGRGRWTENSRIFPSARAPTVAKPGRCASMSLLGFFSPRTVAVDNSCHFTPMPRR